MRRGVVTSVAMLVVTGMVAGFQMAPAPTVPARASAPAAPGAASVHGLTKVSYKAPKQTVPVQTGRKFTATAVTWPSAASGAIALTAPGGAPLLASPRPGSASVSPALAWYEAPSGSGPNGAVAQAAGTPVWAQAVAPAHAAWSGPSQVRVRIEPQSLASGLGVHGVVWQVSGLSAGSGGVRAGLDYKSFAQAYGGNYGSRLSLEELPACALSTPQVAACQRGTPVPSVNDPDSETVSAVLRLPASAPATAAAMTSSVVLAATTATTTTAGGEGGSAGTYGATSLKPAGSWAQGGTSGSFTYSYPISVPSASSPLVPSVSLDYDSGSVDGQTAATQAQAVWAGDGWSTGDSYIEQSFTSCADSPEGKALPSAHQTEDMCYDGNVLTLSLDGSTTALVRDDSTGTWRLRNDDGATVTEVTSRSGTGLSAEPGVTSSNADYWKITERDGTSYHFGMNELPGYASGDAVTDSVDYEPVYGASSGAPCYSSSGFASSACATPYRWHLDYVSDVHGDAMSYYYTQATNYYGQDNDARLAQYVRDSYLKEIDYGFRAGDEYVSGDVPDKVLYGAATRCVASSCPALSSSNSGTDGSDYPDVPYDLNCASTGTCSTYGPTFWSTVRLTSITTEQYSAASSAFENVDTYTLTQTEPATGDGTSPTLWLASISREGEDTTAGGSTAGITLPSVSFGGVDLQNRVDTANFPGLFRYRISQITGEMGSVTQVTYGTPDTCSDSYVQGMTTNAEAASNTGSCYPVWWTPQGYTAPVMDWFEKYAATEVTTSDTTGGALTEQTSYSYAGPAWHYDDNQVVKAKYRTYGQFRGYGTVTTFTGDGVNNPRTKSVTTYYQGMSDDNDSTAVTLTDSQGGTHSDADQLQGEPLETTTYNGDGGTVDHSTIYSYWVSPATATQAVSGLPDVTANMVETAEAYTRQALTDGGTTTWRYTETDTAYDATVSDASFGLATYSYQHTVPVDTAYDQCTATTYAPANTSENLVGLAASAETDSVACSGFTEGSQPSTPHGLNTLGAPSSVSRPAQVVSATQTFYDDTSFSTTFPQAAAPTTGNVTMTRKASGYSGSAFTWQTTARDTYDSYGRVEDAFDGNGNETVTAYTVSSAGLTTGQTVTNPLGQATSTTIDPTRNLTLTSTDANGVVTTEQYDALGRLTSVWLDSRYSTTTPVEANYTYAYTVSDTAVSGVVAKTMGDAGGYATTVTILDSLGRTRQAQTDTPQGGRLITDDFYDSHGWEWKVNDRYWDSSTTPVLSLVSVADNQVPDQDVYTFNSLGQQIQDTSLQDGNTVSVSTTVYNGDRTTVIPPKGGVIKSTVTDPMGRTSEVDEYTTAPALVTPPDTFTGTWYITGGTDNATAYGYDGHGNQSITTAGGHTWTTTYNLLGQATAQATADAGTTSGMTYDGNGNLVQETSADGDTVSYVYDALNRKTAEYGAAAGSQSPSNEIASWAYDNSNGAVSGMKYAIGQLTTETSYSGGAAFTTQQTGFNVFGESLGETVTIPAVTGDTGLFGTYQFDHTYSTGTGLPLTDKYYAAANLPPETITHTYLGTPLDLPSGTGGTVDSYAKSTTYDAYGDVTQEEIGSAPNVAYITSTYDPHTLNLDSQLVASSVSTPAGVASTPADVDEEQYTYDLDGNPTSQTSTRLGSSSSSETQCYSYNGLDQLAAAWTATDSCAATPSASSDASVGDALGAASEYWTTWSYNVLGGMTSQDQHGLSGTSDTVTTNTFGGTSGGPDALTSATSAGGATSTSTFGYDAAGNMTSSSTPANGSQTMTWDTDGKLATVTSSKGTTSYVYDADGNLLLQENAGTTTLYLPGEQLTAITTPATPATTTVTGARIIPLASGGDVVRTGLTTSYYFEIPDQQGTSELYLDNTAQEPIWRQYTPYGAARGTTVTWVDNRGYLSQPADPGTGLDYVGARAYDPVTGQFISPDPVLITTDPQDLNPYDYAEDNPVTKDDPTGELYNYGGIEGSAPSIEHTVATRDSATPLQTCMQMLWCGGGVQPTAAPSPTGTQTSHFVYQYTKTELIGPVSVMGSPVRAMRAFEGNPGAVFPFPITRCGSIVPGEICTLHPLVTPPVTIGSWRFPSAHIPDIISDLPFTSVYDNAFDSQPFGGIGGIAAVRVSTPSAISFEFTVLSGDYFDASGSTIQFWLSQSRGNLYLSQHGATTGENLTAHAAYLFPLESWTWDRQAVNLAELLNPPAPPDPEPAPGG
jgi:RHS repeat-associated protein